ncbi:MAG: FHA domain-containing protein [Lentisphaeria bacterium]|nr:FHA domain-containing protein [Lentisphaeria bacterium]
MNLYFLNGKRQGERWELVPPGICIGREADNDIQLLMPGVSRYHAKIEYVQDGQWKLIDLNSTNGTKLNGKKIEQPEILQRGAEIQIGEQSIRYDEDSRPTAKTEPAPAPKTEPVPAPAPAPVKVEAGPAAKNVTEKIDIDIFSRGKNKSAAGGDKGPASPRKRIQNLLFILLVTVMVCVTIMVFLGIITSQDESRKQHPVTVSQNPFFLEYEKKIVSKDNVFRFALCIENDSALFELNDLKYRRKFSKGVEKVDPDLLKSLLRTIRDTDFMKIKDDPPGSPANGVDDIRVMTIGYGTYLNTVTVRNTYLKRSFEVIENALNQFADSYGLKTMALSQKEMVEEAEQSFKNAEDLFANYQAKPENLREAIKLYQVVIDFLDQFDPKPKHWMIAKEKLDKAQKLYSEIINNSAKDIQIMNRKREYAAAALECEKLMRIMGPEHKNYQRVHDWKIAFEKELQLKRKKGKR